MEIILWILLGACVGGAGVAFYSLRAHRQNRDNIIQNYTLTISKLEAQWVAEQQESKSLAVRCAELETRNSSLQEKIGNRQEELETIKTQFRLEFENTASKLLEDKSKRFTDLNRENITQILKPLGENIENFRRKVEETYDRESKERFSLGHEINRLVQMNQQISTDANNLTKALKGESKVRGDWGEMVLETILEKSGLTKGREYVIQESLRDEATGRAFRPDVILSYPDNRKVIIDSKVSLVDYERYASADDKETADKCLRAHINAIRTHINDLSGKDYPHLVAEALDVSMLFIPIEPAFLVALQTDPELWHYAYQRKVVLISPTTLMASLKLIADLWKRDYQNKNALEIARRGGLLYDKFVTFAESMTRIGDNLSRTQTAYDAAIGQLQTGKGNLLRQVDQLRELGVKPQKSLQLEAETTAEDSCDDASIIGITREI